MRGRLLGLLQPGRDQFPCACQFHVFALVLGVWQGDEFMPWSFLSWLPVPFQPRRFWQLPACVRNRLLDVINGDSPVATGARDFMKVYLQFGGQRPCSGRGMGIAVFRAFAQKRRDCSRNGSPRTRHGIPANMRCRHSRLLRGRDGRAFHGCGGSSSAKAGRVLVHDSIRHLARRRNGDGRLHGQGLTGPGKDLAQGSRKRRFQGVEYLAALDFTDFLPFREVVAHSNQPFDYGAFLHGKAPLGDLQYPDVVFQHFQEVPI